MQRRIKTRLAELISSINEKRIILSAKALKSRKKNKVQKTIVSINCRCQIALFILISLDS